MAAPRTLALYDCCARGLEAGWLAAAIGVPLVFNPWGGSAFELPKVALLRTLVLIMGLLAFVRTIEAWSGPDRPQLRWPRTPLIWPVLALALILGAATALSVNPRTSLWGSYERQQGLLTLGTYVALFFLTVTVLRGQAQADRLWAALVWGSAPVVAYGLLQAAGLDPFDWRTDAASPVLSTIGRANFLGSYLVLVIPLTAGRALLGRPGRCLSLLGAQLLCLAFTQARGAWAGLGVGGTVFGLAWAAAAGARRLALAVAAAALLALGAVALLNWESGPLAALAEVPGLDRLATLARTDVGSTAARLTTWEATLPLVAERPWLGYGPETMRTVFARVFPPQLVYYQGRHFTVDRAHNLWLDLAMSTGLTGVAAFGALLGLLAHAVWRGLRTRTDRWQQVAWASLAAAVAAHLSDLQFGFDLTTTATVFWLMLALAAVLASRPALGEGPPAAIPGRRTLLPYVAPALAVVGLIGLLAVRPLLADIAYWRSQQGDRPLGERVDAGARAINFWPLQPAYRVGLAWVLVERGDFAGAEAQLNAADRLSPDDFQVWAARGELYALWGGSEAARYADAEDCYRRTLELAPNVATYHTGLGLVLAHQGRLEQGVGELERAVELDATDAVAYGHLANLYLALGRNADAAWARGQEVHWAEQRE
jgi:O-antigen ligase